MSTVIKPAPLSPTLSVTESDAEVDQVIAVESDDGSGYGLSLLDNLLKDQEEYQQSHSATQSGVSSHTPYEIPKTPRDDEEDDAAFDRILFSFTQQESTISDQRRSFVHKDAMKALQRCSSAGQLAMIEDHVEEDDDEKLIQGTFSAGQIDDVSDNFDLVYLDNIDDESDEMDDDDDSQPTDGILHITVDEEQGTVDVVQQELIFERTTQSLMISCGEDTEVFQCLRKICNDIKKDDKLPYSVPFSHNVLTFDHTDSFLKLLGFQKDKSKEEWICDTEHRVEEALIKSALLQCHKSLILIHQHASIKDIIFKHRERTGSKDRKRGGSTSKSKSKAKHKRKSTKGMKKGSVIGNANGGKKIEPLQEEKEAPDEEDSYEEYESEDDADYLQLYELMWGITHDSNEDHEAEDVLLLCYPLVTTAKNLMQCLEARFFNDDDQECLPPILTPKPSKNSETRGFKFDSIASSFGVQENVIEFIQRWVEHYWSKDWKLDDKLIVRCEGMMERICTMYEESKPQNVLLQSEDVGRVLRLVDGLTKTISNQQRRQTVILNKLFGDSSKDSESNLLGNGKGKRKGKMASSRSIWNMTGSKYKMPNFKKDLQLTSISHIILAEQITLQTFMIYKSIHPRECLNQSWKDKERKETLAPNIMRYIASFNRLTKWIQTTILGAENVKRRGKTIKKWCKVEQELYKLRNFQALCAVYSALASCAIYKLKDAWHYVAKKHMTQHDMITVVMRSTGNWKNLRRLQLETHPPMIPYFGMFAQDLIAIEETTSNRSNDGNINWNALRRVNTV
eukprot:143135_1